MIAASVDSHATAVGTRFVEALAERNWNELKACFEGELRFRALVPSGLREAGDSESAAEYFKRWFGDADELVLLTFEIKHIQDRLSIRYRLRVHEDAWYIVEQRAYCDVTDGRIARMDVLCSGFLAVPE